MNRTIRDVLLFGAGFAAGAYVMHTVFRTKYQEYADAQIDDVRDHYRKKEADLDTMIEEKAQQKSMEQLTGKYRTESDPEDIVTHDPIEIIQPDEFGDIDDYETRGLTYYADGKLVFDEETMPVNDDDIPNIIGTEALNHFGEFMPSTIHVRNNNYHKDYEIIEKMSEADCFIGIFDDQKAYDGCIIENHVAKLYGVPQYLVNIAYVAPDIMEQRLQNMV